MPRLEETPSAPARPRKPAQARSRAVAAEALSEDAIRAIEEGRADHAAGRTFTMAEIRQELESES